MAGTPPAITRVVIKNYKSIAHCDVKLGALTFLVGRNGAGKSNFLDALGFVSDALRGSIDTAIRERGNFQDLRFKGADSDAPILLQLEVALPDKRQKDVAGDSILAVVNRNGATIVGPLDQADRSVVQDHLYTVGDLLRQGPLEPEQPTTIDVRDVLIAGVQ